MNVDRAKKILGVSDPTDSAEINAVYRDLVKEHHPDVTDHPNATKRFLKIKEAKNVLEEYAEQAEKRTNGRSRTDDRARTDRQSRTEASRKRRRSRDTRSRERRRTEESTTSSWRYQRAERKNNTSTVSGSEQDSQAADGANDETDGRPELAALGRAVTALVLGSSLFLGLFLLLFVSRDITQAVTTTLGYLTVSIGLSQTGVRFPLSTGWAIGLVAVTVAAVTTPWTAADTMAIGLAVGLPSLGGVGGIVYGVVARYYGISIRESENQTGVAN